MGDLALEREVLGLLARQISGFSGRLERAETEERRRVAHALRGACLNVGAFRLATAAKRLEDDPGSASAFDGFEREMTVTAAFVADLLRA